MNTKQWVLVLVLAFAASMLISIVMTPPQVDTTKGEWLRTNKTGVFLCSDNECIHISDVIEHIKSIP